MLRADDVWEMADLEPDERVPDDLPAEWHDDDELILWMLSLPPAERLKAIQGCYELPGPAGDDDASE